MNNESIDISDISILLHTCRCVEIMTTHPHILRWDFLLKIILFVQFVLFELI